MGKQPKIAILRRVRGVTRNVFKIMKRVEDAKKPAQNLTDQLN